MGIKAVGHKECPAASLLAERICISEPAFALPSPHLTIGYSLQPVKCVFPLHSAIKSSTIFNSFNLYENPSPNLGTLALMLPLRPIDSAESLTSTPREAASAVHIYVTCHVVWIAQVFSVHGTHHSSLCLHNSHYQYLVGRSPTHYPPLNTCPTRPQRLKRLCSPISLLPVARISGADEGRDTSPSSKWAFFEKS
ncbi:hypothetical protein J6590_021576 [Homalodisca vitripennis]|nr:hypothetical protein J6590_021576 [Homalodisca vitripennis]